MKQEIEVVTIFKKDKREPIPVKFKMIEGGHKLTVDIFNVLNFEYIGSSRIDYICNALSRKGNLIGIKLEYYRNEGRWLIDY